jgi:hypothetical protein
MDNAAQSVFMFDMDGKYLNKIYSRGQGPGEYANLSYMTVTDNSVIVIDHFTGKQLEYSALDLKFIKEERIFEKIWATEIFTLHGHIYYKNGWSNSAAGKFRLFSVKNDAKDFTKYLPFEEEPLCLGINGPEYAITGNEASLIYSGCDTIYRIRENKVFPEYVVQFKDKKVVYSSGKVENIFRDIKDNPLGRVIGINSIYESDKYLFIDIDMTNKDAEPIGPGNCDYICLYNKQNNKTVIYPQFNAFNSTFDDAFLSVHWIIDNKVISWIEAHIFKIFSEGQLSKQSLKNKAYANRLRSVSANLKDDDNPVLMIYNLK